MRSEKLYLKINPGKFHILKFILEGYDGLALLSSYDIKQGLVYLRFASEMRDDIFELLGSLAAELSPYGLNTSKQL